VQQINDEMIAMDGSQRVNSHTATCKLRCGSAKDGHFISLRLASHYLMKQGNSKLDMTVTRSLTDEEQAKGVAQSAKSAQRATSDFKDLDTAPDDKRAKKRGRAGSKIDPVNVFAKLEYEPGPDEEEDKLVIREQCRDVADLQYPFCTMRTWMCNDQVAVGVSRDPYGLRCRCQDLVFCTTPCLQNHLVGKTPDVASRMV
jgi:hypothetical protein